MKNFAGELHSTSKNTKCPCGSGKKYKRCCFQEHNLHGIEITEEPIEVLPVPVPYIMEKEDQDIFDDIQNRMFNKIKMNIEDAIAKFEILKTKYPDFRRIYNLLGILYQQNDQTDKLKEIVIDTYKLFPDYLFAKIGIVSMYMLSNNYNKFMEVFQGKFNLQELYPNRKRFHVSEAVAFFVVCGRYFAYIGNIAVAQKYYNMAKMLRPNDLDVELITKEILLYSLSTISKNI